MATVSSFSSPSWPNPNPNSDHHSSTATTADAGDDLASLLAPIKLTSAQPPQPQHTHEDGDDNVRDWLNQFLPDTEHPDPDRHDVTDPDPAPAPVTAPVYDGNLNSNVSNPNMTRLI
ncbi:hypothetical protein HanIR_Chr10g0459131 [Helianthus annuus]|nr:hypothetical protein HanIR_Chr10g0459131 [Helianthus annuus]